MQITGRGTENIVLTADREFIGTQWIAYLSSIKMDFVVRLKKNMFAQIQEFGGLNKKRKLSYFNRHIERFGKYCIPFVVAGVQYAVVMTKNKKNDSDEPYIYLLTTLKNAEQAMQKYTQRWNIECYFKHIKRNGFNTECLNLKGNEKIHLMIGLVAMAYVLAIKQGLIKHFKYPIKMKQYKNGKKYFEISIFRAGLDELINLIERCEKLIAFVFSLPFGNICKINPYAKFV